MEEDLPLGSRFVDWVEGKVEEALEVPIIKQGVEFVGGTVRFVDENLIDPLRYASEQGEVSPEAAIGTAIRAGEYLIEKGEEGGEKWAETLGVDPRIGGYLGGGVVESALTAGVGKAASTVRKLDALIPPSGMTPALAGASPVIKQGGSIRLDPNVLPVITATDQPTLDVVRGGVKTGDVLDTGREGKRLIQRNRDIERYRNIIETKNTQLKALRELRGDPTNLKKFIDDADPDLQAYWKSEKGDIDAIVKRLTANKKNAQESLSRAQSNVLPFDSTRQAAELGSMENVNFFRSKIGLSEKKLEESARKVDGFLEQHHLFPKGMSAAFFNKMDELIEAGKATKDDLILMAEYATTQGMRTGDVKANLINMLKDPHNELHTALRAQGAELSKSDWVQFLKDTDNVDDLLVQWRELLAGDAKYNVETAKIWESLYDEIAKIQSK